MDGLRYTVLHLRLNQVRGPARSYICIECDAPAQEWAYDHQDPDEQVEIRNGKPFPFSQDFDHYQPLCKSCHVYRDKYSRWAECLRPGCATRAQHSYCSRHWVGPRQPHGGHGGLTLGATLGTADEHGRRFANRRPTGIASQLTHKQCNSCKQTKHVSGFTTRGRNERNRPDPYKSVCLVCDRARVAARYRARTGRA